MEIGVFVGLAFVAQFALVFAIFGVGIYLYRRLRIPWIPWLLAYFALGLLISLTVGWVSEAVINGDSPPTFGAGVGEFVALMGYLHSIFITVGMFIMLALVLSEFVFLHVRSSLDKQLSVPRWLDRVRRQAPLLGGLLIASRMVVPCIWVVIWIA